MSSKWVLIPGLVAAGLALVAVLIPWWVVSSGPWCGGVTLSVQFRLFGLDYVNWGSCAPQTYMTVIYERNATSYAGMIPVGNVLLAAALLTMVSSVAGLGLVACAGLEGSRPRLGAWPLPLGILGFLLALAAAALVLLLLPGAVTRATGGPSAITGFWGSAPQPGIEGAILTWSPSAGWYLLVLASALFLVATVVRFRELGPKMTPQPEPTPPSS